MASTFMKQRRNSGSSSSNESLSILEKANVTGKNKPSSSNESITKVEKSNAVGKNKISTDNEEVVWTFQMAPMIFSQGLVCTLMV